MIRCKWKRYELTLRDGVWTCADPIAAEYFNSRTAEIFIHAGIPDPDEFIVEQLQKSMAITVISADPPSMDVEHDGTD